MYGFTSNIYGMYEGIINLIISDDKILIITPHFFWVLVR